VTNLLNKLPGHIKTPAGVEWFLFKKLPKIFMGGVTVFAITIFYLHYFSELPEPDAQRFIYICFGLLFTHCFFVGAALIGCIVVMIMKGPAYVADPYELPIENKKLEKME
jgi:hypothetical protein